MRSSPSWARGHAHRQRMGQKVLRWDLTDPTAARYNPLAAIRVGTAHETADIQRLAAMIVDPDGKQATGASRHWVLTAGSLLSGVIAHELYLALHNGRRPSMASIVEHLTDPECSHHECCEAWLQYDHARGQTLPGWEGQTHPLLVAAAREQLNRDHREAGSVLSTALAPLTVFRDPVVAHSTCGSDFTAETLRDSVRAATLYLVVRPADLVRLKSLVRIVLAQLFSLWMGELPTQVSALRPQRVLALIDEFPALGRIEPIEQALPYCAGYGVRCLLVAQDLSQLQGVYGQTESITANCHLLAAFAPTRPETARWLSQRLGEATVVKRSRSQSFQGGGGFLASKRTDLRHEELKRPLLTPDEVMRLPGLQKDVSGEVTAAGDMLVFAAGSAPIYARQRPWFLEPGLRAKVEGQRGEG